ncbi:hypothetical protein V0R59_31380, partial [Pseudomonas sp. 147P]|uniref:hypothetical protein n=1 Tax=Pseudomonas ulcerans TaxID=3115852 RepID=UPI002E7BE8AB
MWGSAWWSGRAPEFSSVFTGLIAAWVSTLLFLFVLVLVVRAYPVAAVTPPAPSAFTAAYFFLGKSKQNRLLLHPALRCAPG